MDILFLLAKIVFERRISIINFIERGSGEPLLLIHGLGNTMELWNPQYNLANHFHLIIPELRGHGHSEISTNITVESFAADIILLLDFLKIDKVNVCGLSLGGVVAQELYIKNPSRVKSLILCHSPSYTPYLFRNIALFFGIKSITTRSKEETTHFFASYCIYNRKDPGLLESAQRTFSINKRSYISSSKSALSKNYLPYLPFIKIPVLVLGSDRDRVTPVYCAFQTFSLLPNSELHIFKECGHLSNIEKKEEFNDQVLTFLGRSNRSMVSVPSKP